MLEGLRVVEYATYLAAPGAGAILADWGADVVKIEPPAGDPQRHFFASIGADIGENPLFAFDNRGKRSVCLDPSLPDGRAAVAKLAAGADVFLTNARPSALARAGLDPDALRAANPRLVYASLTGYGLDGPDADRPGFDITAFWARSGMARMTTPKDVELFPLRTGVGDHTVSLATAAAILAALVERGRTGAGRLVETSLLRTAFFVMGSDMAIQLSAGRLASTRPRNRPVQPLANFFRTADDRWLVLVARQTGDDWAAIRTALDLGPLDQDARFSSPKARRENAEALTAILDDAFARHPFAEIARRLDAEGLAWGPVQTPAEAVADPQVRASGAIATIPGGGETPASPARFHGADDGPKGPAPMLGQHGREVLAQAGYGEAEIEALVAAGALRV